MFAKNRQRLLEEKIAQTFLRKVLAVARGKGLLANEHFQVDRNAD